MQQHCCDIFYWSKECLRHCQPSQTHQPFLTVAISTPFSPWCRSLAFATHARRFRNTRASAWHIRTDRSEAERSTQNNGLCLRHTYLSRCALYPLHALSMYEREAGQQQLPSTAPLYSCPLQRPPSAPILAFALGAPPAPPRRPRRPPAGPAGRWGPAGDSDGWDPAQLAPVAGWRPN